MDRKKRDEIVKGHFGAHANTRANEDSGANVLPHVARLRGLEDCVKAQHEHSQAFEDFVIDWLQKLEARAGAK